MADGCIETVIEAEQLTTDLVNKRLDAFHQDMQQQADWVNADLTPEFRSVGCVIGCWLGVMSGLGSSRV